MKVGLEVRGVRHILIEENGLHKDLREAVHNDPEVLEVVDHRPLVVVEGKLLGVDNLEEDREEDLDDERRMVREEDRLEDSGRLVVGVDNNLLEVPQEEARNQVAEDRVNVPVVDIPKEDLRIVSVSRLLYHELKDRNCLRGGGLLYDMLDGSAFRKIGMKNEDLNSFRDERSDMNLRIGLMCSGQRGSAHLIFMHGSTSEGNTPTKDFN